MGLGSLYRPSFTVCTVTTLELKVRMSVDGELIKTIGIEPMTSRTPGGCSIH